MNKTRKKISAHVPKDLLDQACKLGSLNQTEALILGLKALIAEMRRAKLAASAGKFHFSYDVHKARERLRL